MTGQPLPAKPFTGFPSGVTTLTELPEAFFTELLPAIDDLAELKITLYAFWYIQQLDGEIRFMKLSELRKDSVLRQAIGSAEEPGKIDEILDTALAKAVSRGTFLLIDEPGRDRYYFINTPRTQTIVEGYRKGEWKPWSMDQLPVGLDLARAGYLQAIRTEYRADHSAHFRTIKICGSGIPFGMDRRCHQDRSGK